MKGLVDSETAGLMLTQPNTVGYFEDNIPTLFKSKRDIDVAYAIIELMKQRDDIENFNKKAL